jgi:hypothetical protein
MWAKREAEHPGIWFLIRPPELGDVVAGVSVLAQSLLEQAMRPLVFIADYN